MLGVHISDLHPQPDPVSARFRRVTTDLEKTVAEEEHQAGRVRAAELSIDGQPQGVAVEPVTAGSQGRRRIRLLSTSMRSSLPGQSYPASLAGQRHCCFLNTQAQGGSRVRSRLRGE